MPIPKPKIGEDKKKYIARCMGNPSMRAEYTEQKKRAGVCYSTWKNKPKEEVHIETEVVRVGHKRKEAMKFKNFRQLVYLKTEAPGTSQPVTPTPTKGEDKSAFVARCMKRLKSRQSKEVVPARMKARCVASWAKAHGGSKMSDEVKMSANKVLKEAFQSLQQALRKAVEEQPGRTYLTDFSKDEVVYSKYGGELSSEEKYYKVKYKIEDGEVVLDGTPVEVDRKVTYEGEISVHELVELADLNRQVIKE